MSVGEAAGLRDQVKCGPHTVDVEGDWTVHVHYDGEVSVDHVEEIMEVVQAHFSADPERVALLVDARKMQTPSADARKRMAEARFAATAIYGGSFQQRVFINLLVRAIGLVQRGSTPTRLFATEPEARAFIAKMRAEAEGARA